MTKNIYSFLKQNKPNLTEKSISNYVNNLHRLALRVFGSEFNEDTYYNELYTRKGSKRVMEYLEANVKNLNTRKTHLASLVSCCPKETQEQERACQLYRLHMLNGIDEYNDEQKTQTKSETQRKNWKSWDDIKSIYERKSAEVAYLWKRDDLTPSEHKKLMTFVLASCYVLIPPRRVMDFQFLRWNRDENDNYIQGKKLVFQRYKTAKTYNDQLVQMPTSLQTILKKWKSKAPKDSIYVFTDDEGRPLDQPVISKLLNGFFGHGVSVNMLRHSYITDEVLKDVPDLSELEQKAKDMGHSVGMQMLYRKKS